MRSTIQGWDGKPYDLLTPSVEGVPEPEVIAASLSKLCRFTGHLDQFYSVAEHSVILSRIVEEHLLPGYIRAAANALMHDAQESLVADISTPLKRSSVMIEYEVLEREWKAAVELKYDTALTMEDGAVVAEADNDMGIIEARTMFRGGINRELWGPYGDKPIWWALHADRMIGPLGHREAARSWLSAFHRLFKKTGEGNYVPRQD